MGARRSISTPIGARSPAVKPTCKGSHAPAVAPGRGRLEGEVVVLRSWRRKAGVENLLRASMPRPDDAFPAALRERVRGRRPARMRTAAAFALLLVSVAAFA